MPLQLEPLAVILHWLWLYPLCEVQELASASQVSESTVYRLLADLVRLRWVDAVRHPGLLDAFRSQHYVLTSLGWEQLMLAHQTEGRMQVAESDEMAMKAPSSMYRADVPTWSAYERRVLRLIPRLPYAARLRRLMLDFFVAAPLEQAIQGRPTYVRWHWLPDYRYVCQYRERPVTVHADAVFVWQCATVPVQGDSSAAPISTLNGEMEYNNWHSAFVLLETGLTDMALIRERLRRILCYRESPERWSCYHAFPLVLVVVEHPHQVECWRRAAREASATLRVAPIHGAIAVLPSADSSMQRNSWRWRDLATSASCSLCQLLTPIESNALPGGVETHLLSAVSLLQTQKAHHATLVCAYHKHRSSNQISRNRSGKVRQTQERVAIKNGQKLTAREMAHVSMGLRQRHSALLTLLCRCPLLASQEVAAICGVAEASAACYFRELYESGLLCTWVSQTTGVRQMSRWYLSEQGLRLLVGIHHVPIQRLGEYSSREGTTSPRSILLPKELALLQRYPAHLDGVYGAIADLFRTADVHGATVMWWEAGG